MKMHKAGFVVEGISNFKVFGSLIREASKFNVIPVVMADIDGGGKNYDVVTPDIMEAAFPEVLKENFLYYGQQSIVEIAKNKKLDSVLFINAYRKYLNDIVVLKGVGVRTYALDYFVNSLYAAAWNGETDNVKACLDAVTERLVTSEYFMELEFRVNPVTRLFDKKFIAVGASISDVNQYIDAKQAREIVGLPLDKKIVVVLAPNIRKTHLRKVYGLRTRSKIRRVLKNIKKYCNEQGYALVIKNRTKQWEANFYKDIADYYITEQENVSYPYMSALLLADCELLVHFGSMAVLEAAAVNVPSVGIEVGGVDKLHTYMGLRARRIIKEEFFENKADSIFNYENVSDNIPMDISYKKMKDSFEKMILLDKGEQSYFKSFRNKFLNSETYGASKKILMRVAESE